MAKTVKPSKPDKATRLAQARVVKLFSEARYTEAETLDRGELLHHPKDPQARYMLGSILALLDRNAKALQLLERALALAAGASLLSGPRAAEPARRWCYGAEVRGVDGMSEADFEAYRDRDFWVFGDVLEHLCDPWHVLARIRRVVPAGGHIGASLPKRPALERADVSAGGRLPLSRRRSAGPHPHPPVHAQRCFIDRAASPKPASSRLNVSNH